MSLATIFIATFYLNEDKEANIIHPPIMVQTEDESKAAQLIDAALIASPHYIPHLKTGDVYLKSIVGIRPTGKTPFQRRITKK
jgi:hypothetical protein